MVYNCFKKSSETNQQGLTMKKQKIIFVYNANSGLFSALKDTLHKTVSPNTYQCNLCAITHGAFNVKDEWKKFIENLEIKTEFLHKDEFFKKFGGRGDDFPNAYLLKNKRLKFLISSKEINSAKSISDLKKLIAKKLNKLKSK